jgi:hypothetical protein
LVQALGVVEADPAEHLVLGVLVRGEAVAADELRLEGLIPLEVRESLSRWKRWGSSRSGNVRGRDHRRVTSQGNWKVARRTAVGDVAELFESPEIVALIAELDALRDTRGNKGYGTRALVGACLVKSLFNLATWTWLRD